MNKVLSSTPMLCCLACLLVPVSKLSAITFGYEFVPVNKTLFLAGITGLLCFLTNANLKQKAPLNVSSTVFATILCPLCLLNSYFFLSSMNWFTMILIVLSCTCATVIYVNAEKIPFLTSILGILSGILLLLLIGALVLYGLFGSLAIFQVVKTVPSPNHSYEARLINNDQGALGGATIVEVKQHKGRITLLIGEISKVPMRVYEGGWGEFETMELSWRDDHTLLINGNAYPMD